MLMAPNRSAVRQAAVEDRLDSGADREDSEVLRLALAVNHRHQGKWQDHPAAVEAVEQVGHPVARVDAAAGWLLPALPAAGAEAAAAKPRKKMRFERPITRPLNSRSTQESGPRKFLNNFAPGLGMVPTANS
jgi:hypothetical protein